MTLSTKGTRNANDEARATRERVTLPRMEALAASGKATAGVIPGPPCNLARRLACCGGKGYRIGVKEAWTHAELCTCVAACPACFGSGRIVEGTNSRPCHLAVAGDQAPAPAVVVNLINAAQIPARFADSTLEGFTNFSGNGRELLTEIVRWRRQALPPGSRKLSQGLVLEGPVGVGKTHILAALAKELAQRGMSVRFTDFFQLLGQLRSGFSEGKADATQLKPLIDVDVLLIDELGKGRNNDFELTVLDQLVCGRYNQSKTIIATTNYRLKSRGYDFNIDLERDQGASTSTFAEGRFSGLEQRIGPRIFSRLKETTVFLELTGDDFRRREVPRS